jgi:cysteine synthase A
VLKAEGSSITEGIGQGRITANLEGFRARLLLPDSRRGGAADHLRPGAGGGALPRRLVRHQHRRRHPAGRELGPGHTIVTILCDYGTRYQSKLFNPAFPAREEPACPGLARRHRTANQV